MKKWMRDYFGIELLRALFGVAILVTGVFAGTPEKAKEGAEIDSTNIGIIVDSISVYSQRIWSWEEIADSVLSRANTPKNYRLDYFKVVSVDSVLGVVVEETVWGHLEYKSEVKDSTTYRIMVDGIVLFAGRAFAPALANDSSVQWFQGEDLMILKNYHANEMDWKSYILED